MGYQPNKCKSCLYFKINKRGNEGCKRVNCAKFKDVRHRNRYCEEYRYNNGEKMCSECRKDKCPSRCPNAPELKIIGRCFYCKGLIYDGYERWQDTNENIFCCQDCATNNYGIKEIY
jgi:hypothetical protein